MLKNDLFLKALRREKISRTPIWIMRQAGRYLPEYREVRKKIPDFLTLCKTPELACEVTLQPLDRFDLDALIVFSDILTIPDAMGLELHFVEGEGPVFNHQITTNADLDKLKPINMQEDLQYVFDTVSLVKRELNNRVPLIGFSGSPFTLATYMVEGKSTREFRAIKTMLYSNNNLLHKLLQKLADCIAEYLIQQYKSGADVLMIFDTWGGILGYHEYLAYSLAYMQQIVAKIKSYDPSIPVIIFTKNASPWLTQIADSGCDAVGLDWTQSIKKARELIGHKVALQGNLDPSVLYGDEKTIREQVKTIMDDYGNHPGHIFNLGHGITQYADPDKVQILIDSVKEFS